MLKFYYTRIMKRKLLIAIILFTSLICLTTGCKKKQVSEEESLNSLCEKYGFTLGTNTSFFLQMDKGYTDLILNDFGSITASNEFKAYSLLDMTKSQNGEGTYAALNFRQADKIAKWAQKNGIKLRGHCLVWDAYMPDWFFKAMFSTRRPFVDNKIMRRRFEQYIEDVITHFETKYPGVVYCWDVVNEAIADSYEDSDESSSMMIRTKRGADPNYFYNAFGEDYVKYAFKVARRTVNNVNPDIKLFYNDYNTFYKDKQENIVKLINYLNEEEHLCDGIGMQGYIGGYGVQEGCMNDNDIKLISEAIDLYSSMGLEVQITEMAVRNFDEAPEMQSRHVEFYTDLFRAFIKANEGGKTKLSAVTIWGLEDLRFAGSDNYNYNLNSPYCGLYTSKHEKKPEYFAIKNLLESTD